MDALFVLIHSPLVGPLTWSLVAEQLRKQGFEAMIPELHDVEASSIPYWQQHVESVRDALHSISQNHQLLLVAHSGAGALLPVISHALSPTTWAYFFVDAGLPHGGKSRLDEMEENAPEFAKELRQHLASGGRFPEWTDAELREVVPDDRLRAEMLAELHPRPLTFFEEPMPVIGDWPDAPCGYILFSPPYQSAAGQAQREGWAYRNFDAGHFHMLVDPTGVANQLLEMLRSLRVL